MKSFVEYITEANPVVDKQYRSEALHVFNRIIAKLENLVKAKSTQHMKIEQSTRSPVLYFDLGEFLGDGRYKGVRLSFDSVNRNYGGAYGNEYGKIELVLAIMNMRKVRDPKYKMTNTSYDDHNGWEYSPAFLNWEDSSNYEHLLDTIKRKKEEVRDVFVHEFIHHMDTFRYKKSAYKSEPSYNDRTGYGQEYFNHPKELNAHTQEMIMNIDEWYKTYYLSIATTLKSNFVKKFNSANNQDQYEDAMFLAHKFALNYDMFVQYISDKNFAIKEIREKIPRGKHIFGKHLTVDNKKKVLARLYQYYDEVLKKRFQLLKSTLDKLPKQLNNPEAAAYVKLHAPDAYKTLRKLGMK
jgi:hypothetical protein